MVRNRGGSEATSEPPLFRSCFPARLRDFQGSIGFHQRQVAALALNEELDHLIHTILAQITKTTQFIIRDQYCYQGLK